MSRIAVVTSSPPFAEGGHLVMGRALVQALCSAGHDAGLVLTPQNRFGRQAAEYLATWLTDVGAAQDGSIDQIISLRYPSYAVRHRPHVCWLNHTMREYYDQWDRFTAPLTWKHRAKERVRRRLIHFADRYLLKHHLDRLFVISATVQARLTRWLGVSSEVLYPPPPQRPYRCDGYGDYLFAISRLTPLKRLDLIIDALAQPDAAGIRCIVAGDGPERARLERTVDVYGLRDRIQLVGWVGETELLRHLANCRAVCFPPLDEDYGLVTVEAFAARKAVITCADSGGAAELVHDGVSGFICDPTPASLASAMAGVMGDRGLAERLGVAGQEHIREMTWQAAVARLLLV